MLMHINVSAAKYWGKKTPKIFTFILILWYWSGILPASSLWWWVNNLYLNCFVCVCISLQQQKTTVVAIVEICESRKNESFQFVLNSIRAVPLLPQTVVYQGKCCQLHPWTSPILLYVWWCCSSDFSQHCLSCKRNEKYKFNYHL